MSSARHATWPDVERLQAAGGATLVVPVGATEQHGPHLPLSTDTDIADALAAALATRHPGVIAAPALCFGASGEHADFPGTLSIGTPTTTRVLVELCRSARAAYARVLLLSTHGGNADAVTLAVTQLRHEGHDVRAWAPAWPGDAHAGRTETSLMLALHPARVHLAVAEPGATAAITTLLPRLRRNGVRAVSPNGVLGDPAGADPAHGRRLLQDAARQLDTLLADWPVRP